MTNTKRLKARFIECGISRELAAKTLGISKTSLSYKINNKRQFKSHELSALCSLLNIDDIAAYFFSDQVDKTATK